MSWTDYRAHADRQITDFGLDDFRSQLAERLSQHRQGSAAAADRLASPLSRMLIARGPAFVRDELRPIEHILRGAVAAYVQECAGDHSLSPMLFEYTNATNLFEIVGVAVPPEVMESFRPLILRVETDLRDVPPAHWTKGLVAIVLDQPAGWAPIAGFASAQEVSFVPGATFGPNVQGLIGHLGSAVRSGAVLDQVLPAWRQFLGVATTLRGARQIDEQVIHWTARIVFHHIGKQPLGTVGQRVFDEIDRVIAAGG
jgi:hypothetical protein